MLNFVVSRRGVLVVGLALLAGGGSACGDNPVGGNDPGVGSKTLRVEAVIWSKNTVQSAVTSTQFTTEFTVVVTKKGRSVQDAEVIIGSPSGQLTLSRPWPNGTYFGSLPGYEKTYSLDVTSGADTISGARITGPDFHVISDPTPSGTYKANMPLVLNWAPGGADVALIEAARQLPTDADDTGTFTVHPSFLMGDPGKLYESKARITRFTTLQLNGGITDSFLGIAIRNEATFLIDAR